MNKIALILGNGESLAHFDPRLLEAFPAFGCNYVPFRVPFYICIDAHILKNDPDGIYPRAAEAAIVYLSAKFDGSSKLYDLPYVRLVDRDEGAFKSEQFFTGLTAAYVALKLAYYAGFQKVILYGVDHSPGWRHFRPDYPIAGPTSEARMRIMEWHYALAAAVYARAGREIVNCSAPSRLDMIFRRAQENEITYA